MLNKKLCLFINTYYPKFLNDHYLSNPNLALESYQVQRISLQQTFFGDSDFYSKGLIDTGEWESEDLIVNCDQFQLAWANVHGKKTTGFHLIVEQIQHYCPDVVYFQDLNIAYPELIQAIRPFVNLIVGQIASPLPPQADIKNFDIIFSSFPHFVERFRQQGITSYYQPLAFDSRILSVLNQPEQIYPVTFVGGLSVAHGKGRQYLEDLAQVVSIDFFGYGKETLDQHSAILPKHHGEVWGLDMFRTLAQSKITINRHIDVAEHNANNMRLFEATGCGALLITDYKDNLNELFTIGKEVVAYRSVDECKGLIDYYLNHPEEAKEIAQAGQEKTLQYYSYSNNMKNTSEILLRHLRYQTEHLKLPQLDLSKISSGYTTIGQNQISEHLTNAWKSEDIPLKQRALTHSELLQTYKGNPPIVYQVMAHCLKSLVHSGDSVLEIGCASGYYYEVINYLLNLPINVRYTGVDYSEALIKMALDYYPEQDFSVADGANLPFENNQFDIVVSSGVLLHVPNYQEHINETIRVAKDKIVLHRTPVCRIRPTQYYRKNAYGVETVELRYNETELLSLFYTQGFKVTGFIEYGSSPAEDSYDVSYILKKA